MASLGKEVRKYVKELEAEGWEVEKKPRSSHYKATAPGNRGCIHFGSTPSDPRALKNSRSQARSLGFVGGGK